MMKAWAQHGPMMLCSTRVLVLAVRHRILGVDEDIACLIAQKEERTREKTGGPTCITRHFVAARGSLALPSGK